MRIKAGVLLVAGLTACVIDPHYEDKVLPYGEDVALIQGSRYISHTSEELVFETTIVVLNSFYNGFDNDYLGPGHFEISGHEGSYAIESFDGYPLERGGTASSIFLLVDQSGSYDEVDPYNIRLQAINKFFQDIVEPNTFLLGASARQGALTTEPLEIPSAVFANDWDGASDYLFDLSHRTGGQNAMLDAADQAVDLLVQQTGPAREEMVLLVHGKDGNSVTLYEDLIARARMHAIAVHVIALGADPDTEGFGRLSQETGGLFAACITDKQMVKVFSELERLINGTLYVYKIRVRFKPSQGLVEPGSGWLHQIKVNDPYVDKSYHPVPVTITIPY